MESPIHPMDQALNGRGWRRAQLDDLGEESAKLAARIVCRAYSLNPGTRPLIAVIDVNLWLRGNKVRMDLAAPQVPPFLEVLVAHGLLGITPHGLGLVPCDHEPWHWNPFCLPLVWRQEMNSIPVFNAFVQGYSRSLQDPSWQCPDAARLMR